MTTMANMGDEASNGNGDERGRGAEFREGKVAKAIEAKTAKLPSDLFLWAGCGAIAASLGLAIAGKKQASNFVGNWVPTVLVLGLYNKVVKLAGHDRQSAS